MKRFLLLFSLAIFQTLLLFSQDFSNKGKDFWVGYGYHQIMTNTQGAANVQDMVLYFATDQVTTITITIPGTTYSQTLTSGAAPTVLTSAPIPKSGPNDARLTTESITPENKGIHIVSSKPIVAYAHIYNQSVSGASILFPTNTLGREYYSVNFTNNSNSQNSNCWMYVIAADTGTTIVEIIPSVTTLNRPAGVPFQVTLTQGQVYNVMATYLGNTGGDLTGSIIRSISVGNVRCKRIAVFSGSGRIAISCNGSTPSSDNYMVQAFPKNAWGKKYLTASTSGSQTNNIYRICLSDPTTIVRLNGAAINLPLINNFYYQIPATAVPQKIEADKPILVSQYTTSQGACGNGNSGDPEVIYLSPVEQNISKVLWNATPNFAITEHYFNVIVPNSGTGISSFKLDGVPVSPGLFTVHPQDPAYSYIKRSVFQGSHTIESDSGFNAIAYGFGQFESYGYNAGTNVRDLYQRIGVSSQYGIEASPSVCTGSPFKFKISLPYQPDSMHWNFNNPATVPAIANVSVLTPTFDSVTIINTRTVWWYSLPSFYTWNSIGNFPINITTFSQNTEGCGNTQEIDFNLEVSNPPVAGITSASSVCHGQPVQFDDNTTTVKPTYKWWWNFGDPGSGVNNISLIKNPVHTFSAPGTYIVRYANITTPGCLSDTITKTIVVNAIPTATITGNATICLNGPSPIITFTSIGSQPPYTFTYKINGGASQTITTTGTSSSVTLAAPTNVVGNFNYTLVSVSDGSPNTCNQAQTGSVLINVGLLPTATVSAGVSVCKDASSPTLTMTGANGTPPFTFSYNINGGPTLSLVTTTGNSATVTVPTNTIGSFVYSVTNVQAGNSTVCSQSQQIVSSTFNILPLPTGSISGTASVCVNAPSPVISFSGAGSTPPYTFTYKINGGSNLTVTGNPATVTVPTNTAGVFTYTLVSVRDGSGSLCSQLQTGSSVVTVNSPPTANFNINTPACVSKIVSFIDVSVANSGTITEWNWNFGDPSSGASNVSGLQNPSHIYSTAGTYTTTLTVKSSTGCISPVISKTVVVNIRPDAAFINPEVCLSDTWAQFTDISTVTGGTITAWQWNFGDPASGPANTSTVQNPQHSYSTTGTKNVTLYATSNNGCVDTVVQSFVVNGDIPVAGFTINNASAICGSDTVSITNTSTVNVGSIINIEIYWNNNGAPTVFETDTDPLPNKVYKHLYPSLQTTVTYNIRYRVYSGATCVSDKILPVTINAMPNVKFDPIPNTCLDVAPFQITQASETGGVTPGPAPVFSGPGVSPTGLFDPRSVGPGSYFIKYKFVSNFGCMDVDSQLIRVLAAPVAAFRTAGAICEGQPVTFEDLSTTPAGVGSIISWEWNFGDATPVITQTSAAPITHTYTAGGTYTVTLTVTTSDGCKKSVPVSIDVSTKPIVSFSFSDAACLPQALVTFTNSSTTGTYNWDFGDPGSGPLNNSTALNPTHTYTSAGPFNVKLEVRNASGCVQERTISVNSIHPQPTADFKTHKDAVCFQETVNFQDLSNPADGTLSTWHWTFGDGNISTLQNPSHQFQTVGDFDIGLSVTNSFGCTSDTTKQRFSVYPFPVVNAGPDLFVLEGGSTPLQTLVTVNTQDLSYVWMQNTYLNNNTLSNPVSTPLGDILYTVTVTAKGGCQATDDVFVKLLLGPKIPNTFTPNNDGRNDKWVIEYLDTYPGNRVQVFTKTGQLVFESKGYKTPWDGTLKGKPLPVDTYYYIIETGNFKQPMKGYVTILK